jgi:hypothetical protein
MARRKTLPESVRAKRALAERLGALRMELYGDRGGPEMARQVGIPVRTWYNYEGGVTVPAEVVLKIIELTSVEPTWLLHGQEPKFRREATEAHHAAPPPAMTVGALLRTALQLLESEGPLDPGAGNGAEEISAAHPFDNGAASLASASASAGTTVPHNVERHGPPETRDGQPLSHEAGSRNPNARAEWLAACRDHRCIRVSGDAMAPIVADGASVAFSPREDDVSQLHKKLVVFWLGGEPVVRWFEHCGRYALLKAENPETVPPEVLVDLENPRDPPQFRRVLWINTPH